MTQWLALPCLYLWLNTADQLPEVWVYLFVDNVGFQLLYMWSDVTNCGEKFMFACTGRSVEVNKMYTPLTPPLVGMDGGNQRPLRNTRVAQGQTLTTKCR